MRPHFLLGLTFIGFVSLGLPDGMLGVAWPAMRRQFNLPLDAIGSVLVMFTLGYLVSSFGSGYVLNRMRLGTLVGLSALLSALSLGSYAVAPSWGVIVAMAAVAGLGAGAVDAGLNAYAAVNHGPGMLNGLHAAYGLGAASSPFILGQWLARGRDWQAGYALIAGLEVLLALCFLASRRGWLAGPPAGGTVARPMPPANASLLGSLTLGRVWIGIGVFFIYSGIESSVGTWAFTLLTSRHGLGADVAGGWVSAYWASLAVGRVLAAVLAPRLPPPVVLRAAGLALIAGSGLMLVPLGVAWALAALILLGLACAPVFPLLISMTPVRVGAIHAGNAVGFQIAAATLGQSLIPAGIGVAAHSQGLQAIPWLWFLVALVHLVVLDAVIRHAAAPRSPAPPS